jgi:malonyl CoA-acyl carrier protein transacylase
MNSAGVTNFIETGPGRVLSGLLKRAGPGLTAASLDSVDSLDALRRV